MRLSFNSLPNYLQKGLDSLYLLFGAETLLCEEALEHIRYQAKSQNFLERLRFTHEPGFDWSSILVHCQSVSLFSEKRIIELRIPTSRPGDAGSKILTDLSTRPSTDTTLIVICGAIEKRTQSAKWFKALENHGTVIECPTISKNKLPQWISQRLTNKRLTFDTSAVDALSQFVEGNLLAAAQEINLLALLYPDTQLSRQHIEKIISDHARFDVYGFVDACLASDVSRSIRILQNLRLAQLEPIIILWALARDIRMLCRLSRSAENGIDPKSLFQRFGVWSNRTNTINSALKKLCLHDWERLLIRVSEADSMVKGSISLRRCDIWEEIESIALGVCGVRIP